MVSLNHIIHRIKHYIDPRTAIQQTERAAHQVSRTTQQAVHFTERAGKDVGQYTERSSRSVTQEIADVTVKIEKVVVPILAVAASLLTEWAGGIGGELVAALGAFNARVAGGVEARREGMHGKEAADFARRQEREVGIYAATAAGLTSLAVGAVGIVSSLFAPAEEATTAAELAGEAGHINTISADLGASAVSPDIVTLSGDTLPALAPAPEAAPLQELVSIGGAGQDVLPTVPASSSVVQAASGGFWSTAAGIGEKLIGPAVTEIKSLFTRTPKPVDQGNGYMGTGGSGGGGAPPAGALDLGGDLLDKIKNASPLVKGLLGLAGAIVTGVIVQKLTKEKHHG